MDRAHAPRSSATAADPSLISQQLAPAMGRFCELKSQGKRSPARREPPRWIRATAVPRKAVTLANGCQRAEPLLHGRQREHGRCRPPAAPAALPTVNPKTRTTTFFHVTGG